MNTNLTLNCPQCRKAIPKLIDNVKIAGCPHCGGIAAMGNDGFLRTHKTNAQTSLLLETYQEPFILGSQMQHDGVNYTVYAIYIYLVKYKELDEEDRNWEHSEGYVTEWYAKNNRGDKRLMVMSDTDDKFYIVYDRANNQLTEAYKDNFIEEGTFQLTSFAGMDDDALDEKGFYRVFKNQLFLEGTQSNFSQNTYKTFFSEAISPSQVKRMHVIEDEQEQEAEADFKNITFYRNLFGIAFSLILCLIFFTSSNNTEGGLGKTQMVSFEYIVDEKGGFDTIGLHPKSAGIFDLKAGKNYQFRARSNVYGTNRSADFSVSIIRQEDKKSVADVDIAFFTESGRDDEGAWTENVLDDAFKFHVDESGKYDVLVSPDYDDITNIPPCTLNVSINGTGYYTFYLMTLGFFFLAWVICQWQRENIIAFADLPYDTTLHDLVNQ
jgi:hypothetical protein